MAKPVPQWSLHLPDTQHPPHAELEPYRVLIAGCGDLGIELARQLLVAGHQVSGLRRHWPSNAPAGINRLSADLTQPSSLAALCQSSAGSRYDQVVYCPSAGARDEAAYHAIYVQGLANLMTVLDRTAVQRLLFVSSTAVYGQVDGSWVDESSATEPTRFNGQILLKAERAAERYGVPLTVVRLAGLYGPGRNYLIRQVRAGAACQPDVYTNRIHRVDAARAIAHLLGQSDLASCYIGVDNCPVEQCEVMSWIASQLGVARPSASAGDGLVNKRCSNRRLLASGFDFVYPDFRVGYAQMLADS